MGFHGGSRGDRGVVPPGGATPPCRHRHRPPSTFAAPTRILEPETEKGTTLTNYRTILTRGAAAFVLVLALGACSDDGDDVAADPSEETAPAEPSEEAAEGAEPETVVVLASDFEFADVPDTVPVGTKLTLHNDAPTELHELVAFRVADDEDRTLEEIMDLPQDEMQAVLGEPATVILTPPDSEDAIFATGDGSLSEPGRYLLACFIPTGVDPDEYLAAAADSDGPPDVGEGPPHIVHGMYAELQVE